MGNIHKIDKNNLKAFFAAADNLMRGRYRSFFMQLGVRKGSKGPNFHCPEERSHTGGVDAHPSASIDNETGKWHCFACGTKGNLQSYWSEYIKGVKGGDSYSDFLIDLVPELKDFSTTLIDPEIEKLKSNISKLSNMLDFVQKRTYNHGDLKKEYEESLHIPLNILNEWVDNLLADEEAKKYLYDTRRITEDVISKYRIGSHTHRGAKRYIFPIINEQGKLINAKAYNPNNISDKWCSVFPGRPSCPTPMNNLTQPKIYFFEGEPDMYCAISFGIKGAITLGSTSMNDVNVIFGKDDARRLFHGKEVVICLDSDESAIVAAKKLATSLYEYVKQLKIINLNISETNPHGLNPEAMKRVVKNGKESMKRSEKDFTDFMIKNGFNDNAVKLFNELEASTPVFTINTERSRENTYKVTIEEARFSKYHSGDDDTKLEVTASVDGVEMDSYMYPTSFDVSCRAMNGGKTITKCKECLLTDCTGFADKKSLRFNIVSDKSKADEFNLYLRDSEILGLITNDTNKFSKQKKMCGINSTCTWPIITDNSIQKISKATLIRDSDHFDEGPDEPGEDDKNKIDQFKIDAYIVGDDDLLLNKTYKLECKQVIVPHRQNIALFCNKAIREDNEVDSFVMNDNMNELLSIFKVKDGESIEENLKKRYDILSEACGITGRNDLFFINDMAFFSHIYLNNPITSKVSESWVEVLIAGDTRTGKSFVTNFMRKHYMFGSIIRGNDANTRTGLFGGSVKQGGVPRIKWGAFPCNDMGLVVVDEMGRIDLKVMDSLIDMRSSGIAAVNQSSKAITYARNRKIMLSNPREAQRLPNSELKYYKYGIEFLLDLCGSPEALARFDIIYHIKGSDIDSDKMPKTYKNVISQYTNFQCRNLLLWSRSRGCNDVVFEDGFENTTYSLYKLFSKKYHVSTKLITPEIQTKLVKLSAALATALYSTVDGDYNKVLVKKEHALYVADFLERIYDGDNIKLDEYSNAIFSSEKLGDMSFMENICDYIDVNMLFREDEMSEKAVQQCFQGYLDQVRKCHLYIPSVTLNNDSIGMPVFEGVNILIGLLISRNCLARGKYNSYRKTKMFNTWLAERIRLGERAPKSDILECQRNQDNNKIIEGIKYDKGLSNKDKEQKKIRVKIQGK